MWLYMFFKFSALFLKSSQKFVKSHATNTRKHFDWLLPQVIAKKFYYIKSWESRGADYQNPFLFLYTCVFRFLLFQQGPDIEHISFRTATWFVFGILETCNVMKVKIPLKLNQHFPWHLQRQCVVRKIPLQKWKTWLS